MLDVSSVVSSAAPGHSSSVPNFSAHACPATAADVQHAKIAYIACRVLFWLKATAFVVVGTLALASVITLPPVTIILLSLGCVGMAALTHCVYWKYRGTATAFYGVVHSQLQDGGPGLRQCQAYACADTIESFGWKKRLIEAAEHNIVLSGNYCGGESFDQILELIEKRLGEVPALKVVIICSPLFITNENQAKINALAEAFPQNFQLVLSPDIVHVSPGIKKTTNHTKVLAIDNGKYFIMGGSGIEDKYAFHDGLRRDEEPAASGGLMEKFLPRGFRDMDFLFDSSGSTMGREVFNQAVMLAHRWEGIDYVLNRDVLFQGINEFDAQASVARRLLQEFDPDLEQSTTIEAVETLPKAGVRMALFCIGPELEYNPFEEALVEKINLASKQIYIDHMYFHPSARVQNALIRAVNRGVKLVLITNGNHKTSPGSHQLFGDRNRHHYQELLKRIKPVYKKNVHIYEFNVKKTTLHKKVVVVDNTVFGGSSNLGYKSLETMSDHEMNFMAEGAQFAKAVIKILRTDRIREVHAEKIQGNSKLSFCQKWAVLRHKLLAPLIG